MLPLVTVVEEGVAREEVVGKARGVIEGARAHDEGAVEEDLPRNTVITRGEERVVLEASQPGDATSACFCARGWFARSAQLAQRVDQIRKGEDRVTACCLFP